MYIYYYIYLYKGKSLVSETDGSSRGPDRVNMLDVEAVKNVDWPIFVYWYDHCLHFDKK